MTVAELKVFLANYPDDMNITLWDSDSNAYCAIEIQQIDTTSVDN